ncbi:hypothetical protein ACHAWF_002234, partial [Thalassiosira exigua]
MNNFASTIQMHVLKVTSRSRRDSHKSRKGPLSSKDGTSLAAILESINLDDDDDDSHDDNNCSGHEEVEMPPLMPGYISSDDSDDDDSDAHSSDDSDNDRRAQPRVQQFESSESCGKKICRNKHQPTQLSGRRKHNPMLVQRRRKTHRLSKAQPDTSANPKQNGSEKHQQMHQKAATTKQKSDRPPPRDKSEANKGTNFPTSEELRSIGLEFAGFSIDRQNVCDRTNNGRFSAHYGVSALTLSAAYKDLAKRDPSIGVKDFLMTMNALKHYLSEHSMAGRWKCHEETYRKRWKVIVAAIASLKNIWKNSLDADFPEDQIFILTVDGVNFTIYEPRMNEPGPKWYDHKSNSAGISYEVAIDIRRSRILWIRGPRPGGTSEIATFNGGKKKDKVKDPNCLANQIPEGKRVIGDSAFKSSKKVSTLAPGDSKQVKNFKRRAAARQETLFKRFKDFGILRHRFRHGLGQHRNVLDAVAV